MPGHGGAVPKINQVVAPDGSASIEVEFDPNAHGPAGIGLMERVVFLETSAGMREFNIKAMVTP